MSTSPHTHTASALPATDTAAKAKTTWRDYWQLTKPKVVLLMLVTTLVGMQLASDVVIPFSIMVAGLSGVALAAGAAAAINHSLDRRIDALMTRTKSRPIVVGKVSPGGAMVFALALTSLSMWILLTWVNALTAVLTLATLVGYAFIYTGILKRLTSQNIVIGGLAGATPPLLGWTAITNQVDALPLLLVLIIFTWTPPHFWALAIHRHKEYARAQIPMLPVTHGVEFTKTCVLLYTVLLTAVTMLPFATQQLGGFYATGALGLGCVFMGLAAHLKWRAKPLHAMRLFHFSNIYLLSLFLLMLGDHLL